MMEDIPTPIFCHHFSLTDFLEQTERHVHRCFMQIEIYAQD